MSTNVNTQTNIHIADGDIPPIRLERTSYDGTQWVKLVIGRTSICAFGTPDELDAFQKELAQAVEMPDA